jgi:hypothetical protein
VTPLAFALALPAALLLAAAGGFCCWVALTAERPNGSTLRLWAAAWWTGTALAWGLVALLAGGLVAVGARMVWRLVQ